MPHIILTFANVRQVIKADRVLAQQGFTVRVIPVPEHISSECGMCIEADNDQADVMLAVLERQGVKGKAVC